MESILPRNRGLCQFNFWFSSPVQRPGRACHPKDGQLPPLSGRIQPHYLGFSASLGQIRPQHPAYLCHRFVPISVPLWLSASLISLTGERCRGAFSPGLDQAVSPHFALSPHIPAQSLRAVQAPLQQQTHPSTHIHRGGFPPKIWHSRLTLRNCPLSLLALLSLNK